MLIIRTAQLDAFQATSRMDFCWRMVAHLRQCFADTIDNEADEDLSRWIWSTSVHLETYGIVTECDVEQYLELAVCHANVLRQDPLPDWIREILTFPERAANEKIDRLLEVLVFGPPALHLGEE